MSMRPFLGRRRDREDQIAVPLDRGEEIVEVVGDATGESTDRFELLIFVGGCLGPPERLLLPPPIGNAPVHRERRRPRWDTRGLRTTDTRSARGGQLRRPCGRGRLVRAGSKTRRGTQGENPPRSGPDQRRAISLKQALGGRVGVCDVPRRVHGDPRVGDALQDPLECLRKRRGEASRATPGWAGDAPARPGQRAAALPSSAGLHGTRRRDYARPFGGNARGSAPVVNAPRVAEHGGARTARALARNPRP